MYHDLITIIVPVYNVEKYVERCINSLLTQTYKEIEVLLVDDGSTDNSGNFCDVYAQDNSNVYSFHTVNGGLSAARNFGLERANGKYVCFVDSDDYVDIHFIETLYYGITVYETDISAINYQEFDDDIEKKGEITKQFEIIPQKEAIKYLFNNDKYCNYSWNKMYRRTLFDDIRFPVGRKMEDLGTTYKLFNKCKKISFNNSKLYYYYQRSDSILHTMNSDFYYDKLLLSNERFNFLKNKYPDMQENDCYIMNTLLEVYPYIHKYDGVDNMAKEILLSVNNTSIWGLTNNRRIKLLLLKCSRKTYLEIFKGQN